MPIWYERISGFNALRFHVSGSFHTGMSCWMLAGGRDVDAS
jgi:hypothetical protein